MKSLQHVGRSFGLVSVRGDRRTDVARVAVLGVSAGQLGRVRDGRALGVGGVAVGQDRDHGGLGKSVGQDTGQQQESDQ